MRKWPCKLDPKNRICCLSCKLDKIKCTLKLDTSKSCGEVTGANGLDDHGQLLTRRYCDPTSDIDSQSDFDEYIVEMTLTTTTVRATFFHLVELLHNFPLYSQIPCVQLPRGRRRDVAFPGTAS